MEYQIRPCKDSNADYIWEMGFQDVQTEENARVERFVFKVVDERGAIFGGCVLDIDETKTAEFDRLWVDECYRRRGLGSALIRTAEWKAREMGCRMIVNAYTFDFQPARELFERYGYQHIGTVKDWPKGHECYTLVKDLNRVEEIRVSAARFDLAPFEIEPGNEEDGEMIAERLEAFNRTYAPRSHGYLDMNKVVTDDTGRLIAGCIVGVSGWDTLHIDVFWVDESFRACGVDSYLLGEIEREAKAKGAYFSSTAGIDVQAAFFKRHGYTVSAVLEGPQKWYMMHKHL